MTVKALLVLSLFILFIVAVKGYEGSTFDPAISSQQKTIITPRGIHN